MRVRPSLASFPAFLSKQIIFYISVFFLSVSFMRCADAAEKPLEATLFFTASCHKCQEVKESVIPQAEKDFGSRIVFIYRDIADIENYKLLLAAQKRQGSAKDAAVPTVLVSGRTLVGVDEIKSGLYSALLAGLETEKTQAGGKHEFDLLEHFYSFTPLAISSAGLIDGINPCAFTVIVFFVSFLSLQGYRRRHLLGVGIAFTAAVFLTYLALGLGLFSVFYYVKGFWIVRQILNIGIGIFSILLGFLAVYDFIVYKKTGSTESLALQLPRPVKDRIHKVIGQRHRKTGNAVTGNHLLAMSLTAFFTGFLVSILEAVCTGQTYLPTITFILKTAPQKAQAFGYLVLYNLMFIIPLFVILLCALLGVTSGQFAAFLKRHFLTTKALMALLFFGLGIFLLWRG